MRRPAVKSRVDAALRCARLGYRVFPAYVFDDGKRPASKKVLCACCPKHSRDDDKDVLDKCHDCKGGHHAATTDEAEIKRLWKARPGALMAVLPPPGVLIIDDDSHVFDEIWDTMPRVRSQSGKHHYWFQLGPGQEPMRSENGILFGKRDGSVDIRGHEGDFWIFAPAGDGKYVPENGWRAAPGLLPVLPQWTYERLRDAPRSTGGGGVGTGANGSGYAPGLPAMRVGNWYDRLEGAAEGLLDDAGWFENERGEWVRPGGTRKSAMLGHRDGVWFFNVVTTSPDALPLLGEHYYTPSMLRALFEFAGDWRTCYRVLIEETPIDTTNPFNEGQLT